MISNQREHSKSTNSTILKSQRKIQEFSANKNSPSTNMIQGHRGEVDLNNNSTAETNANPKYRNGSGGTRRDVDSSERAIIVTGGPTQTLKTGREAVAGLPNEDALIALMEESGYPISQNNGQRRYGPPTEFKGTIPCRGCEVFVGKLPRDCYEDELVPVFETVGKVYEMRLMMDYNGQNRGYAFVVYFNKTDAQRSVRTMNNFEIRKGRLLGVCQSVDNCRLFIGGIPKKVKRDEIMEEISKVTDAVTDVIVYPSATDKSKNRGFAFVEYETHRAAAMARRKLMNGKIQLWGHPIAVDWAEPEQEVDEEIMEQVKVLYVRNLQLNTTEETIENLFKKYAEVERVKKIKDFCFVHYATREGARRALDDMQGKVVDGAEVEVTLAKPVDKEHYRQQRAVAKLMQMANQCQQYPNLSNMPPDISAIIPPTFNAAGGMPLVYPPPSFMQAGQYGGVGVRPVARGRGRTAAGSRSAGGRAYVLNGFLPALHPLLQATMGGVSGYQMSGVRGRGKAGVEDQLYDILPGMDLSPTNPVTLKPQQTTRTPVQLLDEICQKNNWGSPIYTLHSTVSNDGQLFLYKVTIPPLGHTYQPQKLCRNVDEAKGFAAEYTLSQLNADARVSPGSPVTTTPYAVRAAIPTGMNGARVTVDPGTPTYPGYIPITTQPGIMAKVTFAGAMPQPQHGYFEFPDPQEYQANMYPAY